MWLNFLQHNGSKLDNIAKIIVADKNILMNSVDIKNAWDITANFEKKKIGILKFENQTLFFLTH